MNIKILIVGGAGFIGHNLALKLKQIGAKVAVIDSLTVNNLYSIKRNEDKLPFPKLALKILDQRFSLLKSKKIIFKQINAQDFKALNKFVNEFKPKVVIHLAAVSHASKSNKFPLVAFNNSFVTLQNSLEIIKNKIDHFIFLSSSMVYGDFKKQKVTEDEVCNPIGIYGALKFSAEKLIKAYGQVYNLPYTIIRPSALYGERCISRRVGQIFIESAINKSKIVINGDGRESLDFTYIDDLVDGIICAIKSKNSFQEIFNLTYGSAKPINALIKIIKNNFSDVEIEYKKREKLMPIRGTLDIKKARRLIGYKPSWPLEKGYLAYIKWYKNFYKKF